MSFFLRLGIYHVTTGGKRTGGSSWLSVSQGIAEDTSDLVSGFATVGDDSVDYPNEYWDSDEYDDDDDVGYTRQPIEEETWFLAHEIDYPSDNEKGTGHGSVPDLQERVPRKDEDDDQSFAEEDSYFSGEQYLQAKTIEQVAASDGPLGFTMSEMYRRRDENDLIAHYDGQLMDVEELNLMRAEPVWQGFVTQSNEFVMLGNGKAKNDNIPRRRDDLCMDDDQHCSVRSIGVGINSDAADIGSEMRESLVGESSEGDVEYFHDRDTGISGIRHSQNEKNKSSTNKLKRDKLKADKQDTDKYILDPEKGPSRSGMSSDVGFSFPPPLRSVDMLEADSSKSLWSSKANVAVGTDLNDYSNGIQPDDMLATWRRKSNESSPRKSFGDDETADVVRSRNSISSSVSNADYAGRENIKRNHHYKENDVREEEHCTTLEDEEAAALQEQVRQIKSQEDEFEIFNLKIVHRKNRHVLVF